MNFTPTLLDLPACGQPYVTQECCSLVIVHCVHVKLV